MIEPRTQSHLHFVFSGRLSSQKNLHTLLDAYRIFRERTDVLPSSLTFFGGEDFLGSPNMGTKDSNYAKLLRETVIKLELTNCVEFSGFLEREELHRRLTLPHILVIPSLHSDENFGMSALRSLCYGMPVVLSDWGGHGDFSLKFSNQVFLTRVLSSPSGPYISASELADSMQLATKQSYFEPKIPSDYSLASISDSYRTLAQETNRTNVQPLLPSLLAEKILENRRQFAASNPVSMQIFSSYSDPLVKPFFEAYGMRAR
jgi:hypothetical protein